MMKKVIYTVGLSMMLSACTDWLTVQPEASMTTETLFQTDNGVKYGLNGAYMLAQYVYGPSGSLGGTSIVENMANTYLYTINSDGENGQIIFMRIQILKRTLMQVLFYNLITLLLI